MSGHNNLPTTIRVGPKFLRKLPKQGRIELVLGLFHTQQRVRFRIVEKREVGENLDPSVRYVAS